MTIMCVVFNTSSKIVRTEAEYGFIIGRHELHCVRDILSCYILSNQRNLNSEKARPHS